MILDFSKIFALLVLASFVEANNKCSDPSYQSDSNCEKAKAEVVLMVAAEVCIPPATDKDCKTTPDFEDFADIKSACITCDADEDKGIMQTCLDNCLKDRTKTSGGATTDNCYKDCVPKCGTNYTNVKACKVLETQAEAMKDVCKDPPEFTNCKTNTDIKTIPPCLKKQCEPNDDFEFESDNCLDKCFTNRIEPEERMRREGESADTACYKNCYQCNDESTGDTCVVLKNQAEAMNNASVCNDTVVITECHSTDKISTTGMPLCLVCYPKDGFEFESDECLEKCFLERRAEAEPNGGVAKDIACYAGCSEKITTTATTETTTTTTAAKDKKPSGVDPPVVAPVVPSNNQTLGNNSTAAPKPNAPNSNNSTGADAAIHVGQTLSLARMIFTALALVMAVKVIAA